MSPRRKKTPPPAPPAKPPGGRPRGKTGQPEWADEYLVAVRRLGLYQLAAEAVGVNPRTVARYREMTPAYDALCLEARLGRREELEDTLVKLAEKTGNPIGILARLKAMGATEYIEQHLVRQLSMNVTADLTATPDKITALLRGMLADATEPTRLALEAAPEAPETDW